jgi:hypothetical protein
MAGGLAAAPDTPPARKDSPQALGDQDSDYASGGQSTYTRSDADAAIPES